MNTSNLLPLIINLRLQPLSGVHAGFYVGGEGGGGGGGVTHARTTRGGLENY